MLSLNLHKFKFGNSKRQEKLYFLNEQGLSLYRENEFYSFFRYIDSGTPPD